MIHISRSTDNSLTPGYLIEILNKYWWPVKFPSNRKITYQSDLGRSTAPSASSNYHPLLKCDWTFFISQHWDCTRCWIFFSQKTCTPLFYIIHSMGADDLETYTRKTGHRRPFHRPNSLGICGFKHQQVKTSGVGGNETSGKIKKIWPIANVMWMIFMLT